MTDKITLSHCEMLCPGEETSLPTWLYPEVWNTMSSTGLPGEKNYTITTRPPEKDQTLLQDHCFGQITYITPTGLQRAFNQTATTTMTNEVSGCICQFNPVFLYYCLYFNFCIKL